MKYRYWVANEESGFISDDEIIEAPDKGEAEYKFYRENPECGCIDGDQFFCEEANQ